MKKKNALIPPVLLPQKLTGGARLRVGAVLTVRQ
jgi:hypothetical protein